jgi:hypothetical protein
MNMIKINEYYTVTKVEYDFEIGVNSEINYNYKALNYIHPILTVEDYDGVEKMINISSSQVVSVKAMSTKLKPPKSK